MTILLLAGTQEARRLAEGLAAAGVPAVASIAGAVRAPLTQPLPTRIGGFGGEAGFRAYLRDHGINAVIDATHPFAARMTERTTAVCADMGMPCLRLERPGWTAGPGDDWTWILAAARAADHIPAGVTVFLATGRQTLPAYAGLAGCRLYLRVIDPPKGPFPYPNGEFIIGRPPFALADEIALFRRLGIGWVISKDAGGTGNRAKLDAARNLGLRVLMVQRPPPPPGLILVRTVAAALDWVSAL